MDWKKYEEEIYESFHSQYPDAEITLNNNCNAKKCNAKKVVK
jgi:hypothetical protein